MIRYSIGETRKFEKSQSAYLKADFRSLTLVGYVSSFNSFESFDSILSRKESNCMDAGQGEVFCPLKAKTDISCAC